MAKVIDKGLVKEDDPMFSEGLKVNSVRRLETSTKPTLKNTAGEITKLPAKKKPGLKVEFVLVALVLIAVVVGIYYTWKRQ